MGRQIIRQPNDKYAIWSSVVDSFIGWNVTPDEIKEIFVEEEKCRIESEVDRIVEQLEAGGKPYYQFTRSFEDCIETIRQCHGDDTDILKAMKELL